MKKESFLHKIFILFLRKLGLIKTNEFSKSESDAAKLEMCRRAINSNVCPHTCEICAWNVVHEVD